MALIPKPKVDLWPWGKEQIIWGFDLNHAYTCKILEPKKGRSGCLSLQYHNHKSETWIVLRGKVWILVTRADSSNQLMIATRVMQAGDVQNLPAGTIHRLMGLSDDAQVIEPSTPDRHSADKSVAKDVVRLHCIHGRPASPARNAAEARIVEQAIKLTEQAISAIESGKLPEEVGVEHLAQLGALSI